MSFVCADCFDDKGIKDFIASHAEERTCSFCDRRSRKAIAAPISEVTAFMLQCVRAEYDYAGNCLGYESREGGYLGTHWDGYDFLVEELEIGLPNDHGGSLFNALLDKFGDETWCQRDPYGLNREETLRFSWEEFCRVIKHQRRFFFLSSPSSRNDSGLLEPNTLLEEIGECCEKFSLLRSIPAGTVIYRARPQPSGQHFASPLELGPPPTGSAIQSNRMSPPGISMFYGSDNPQTAIRETANQPGTFTVGKFEICRPLTLLDLDDIPPIPSLFEELPDSLEYYPRPLLTFLHKFAREIAKPIARDDRVHVEYIPTQVITEYFRSSFKHNNQPIDGIRYRSSRHAKHISIVLFAGPEAVIPAPQEKPEIIVAKPWLRLASRKTYRVNQADMDRWATELPVYWG